MPDFKLLPWENAAVGTDGFAMLRATPLGLHGGWSVSGNVFLVPAACAMAMVQISDAWRSLGSEILQAMDGMDIDGDDCKPFDAHKYEELRRRLRAAVTGQFQLKIGPE